MITTLIINVSADGKNLVECTGKSSDTKPTNVANGSRFIEIDTSTLYFFDGASNTWRAW